MGVKIHAVSTGARYRNLSLWFALVALVSLFFADIFLYQPDPWEEFGRIGWGMITPFWPDADELLMSALHTVSFALLGVAVSAALGSALPTRSMRSVTRGTVMPTRHWPELPGTTRSRMNGTHRLA